MERGSAIKEREEPMVFMVGISHPETVKLNIVSKRELTQWNVHSAMPGGPPSMSTCNTLRPTNSFDDLLLSTSQLQESS